MRISIPLLRSLALAFPLTASTQAPARQPAQELSLASTVARSIRANGSDARALPLLTRARPSGSATLLYELADTLAAIAIEPSVEDVAHTRARSVAIELLHLAGMGETGLPGEARGVPYGGAAVRLRRVVESSHYVDARAGALKRLNNLDRSAAFASFLRQQALLPSIVAATAIELLADARGENGRAIARELYLSRAVTNDLARRILESRAHERGW